MPPFFRVNDAVFYVDPRGRGQTGPLYIAVVLDHGEYKLANEDGSTFWSEGRDRFFDIELKFASWEPCFWF